MQILYRHFWIIPQFELEKHNQTCRCPAQHTQQDLQQILHPLNISAYHLVEDQYTCLQHDKSHLYIHLH